VTQIDFILNVVGLLLWLNWQAAESPVKGRPGTPIGLLRTVGPAQPGYYYWLGIPILLVVRALFYWEIGPPVHWIPRVVFGPVVMSFRSDLLGRMLIFSLLSFIMVLGIFYLWLLFLSWLNGPVPNDNPALRLMRLWLGRLERWPSAVKLILPLAVAVPAWFLLNVLLARMRMVPATSPAHLLAQGAIIGLTGCLTLKYVIVALVLLHAVNSYVYLGEFALWRLVDITMRRLLRPLDKLPLKVARIDFAPLVFVVLVLLAARFAQRGLFHLYQWFL
jgi:uncharacterized protein YggT (Ycf19 family)